ncbi:MAG: metallophosphoesterase [Acidobacteriota bacterium]
MPRLLHISDIHFGPKHRPEAAEGVLRLVEDVQPDALVVSGDLTQRAKPRQFQEARAFIDRVTVPVLTVPGNHDVPLYRGFFAERVFFPYRAYQRHFSEELEPVLELPGLTLIGVNTAFNWTTKHGRITGRQLDRLEGQLRDLPEVGFRVVVIHHEMIPAPRFGLQTVMAHAWELADVLSSRGVDMVLAGHLHQAFVSTTEDYYAFGRRPVIVAHSGTTTSTRGRGGERGVSSCNLIQLDAGATEIRQLRWTGGTAGFEEHSVHRYRR